MAGEPTAFGQPITFALYAICIVHLILCVVIMGNLVIGTPLDLGGVLVSPLVQWFYGSFTLVSIVAIICAGVGALFHIESHLNAYGWVLLISSFVDAIFLVVFLFLGKSCTTRHSNSNHLVATMSCGIHDGMALLCLTLLVIFKLLALFIVNKCRAHVRSASNQKLVMHISKQSEPEVFEAPTLPPGSSHWMQPADHMQPPTMLPHAMGSVPMTEHLPSMRSYTAPFGAMQNAPQTIMSMMPSMMRSNYTSFGAKPFPGPMVPSMGPSMNAYGAVGKLA